MPPLLENSSVRLVTLYGAILAAGFGGWYTACALGNVSTQIAAVSSKTDLISQRVEGLAQGQEETHAWIKVVSQKVDDNSAILAKHDITLTHQADQLDELQRTVNKDAAANRADDAKHD